MRVSAVWRAACVARRPRSGLAVGLAFPASSDGQDMTPASRGQGEYTAIAAWSQAPAQGLALQDHRPARADNPNRTRTVAVMSRLTRTFAAILCAAMTVAGVCGQKADGPRCDAASGMRFVFLPPGRFLMGSPPGEPGRGTDESQHEVVLTRGFWIARMEVTRAQWERVMGPGERHPEKPNPFRSGDPNLPVVAVSYRDIEVYLRRLEARSPGQRFRLPTEAEWEYACRARTTTPFHTGLRLRETQANYDARLQDGGDAPGRTPKRPAPVGSYPPNAWGLYDLHGNVWEWTSDWYGPYPHGTAIDPLGPAQGTLKVIRGGSWAFGAGSARSACRYHHDPRDWGYSIGFRVVWVPGQEGRRRM